MYERGEVALREVVLGQRFSCPDAHGASTQVCHAEMPDQLAGLPPEGGGHRNGRFRAARTRSVCTPVCAPYSVNSLS
ncbi:hypothetical protein [Sciscionella marina]|uniref:hypothetical protein n=1 Tax=Sciscionella marina TaxID=508770 RepID=UPI00036C43C6|nr:hypothetical protein [Sciscionella marina]